MNESLGHKQKGRAGYINLLLGGKIAAGKEKKRGKKKTSEERKNCK